MAKQYAVSPINHDGSHDADIFQSRSRAAAEREARKVARSGQLVAATVVEYSIDADGDLIWCEAVAAVGDARALDAAGYADLPRLADDARKVHKVEKVDGGWSCSVEYRVETINADGEIIDMVWASDTLDDAVSSARAWFANIERAIEREEQVADLRERPVAVIVERAVYSVPTRAEARRLAADNMCGPEPSDLDIEQTTVWHMQTDGSEEALRQWVVECACQYCTRPTPPTTPTPTDDAAQTSTSTAAQDAAEVETPRALWKVEADDLDRLPSLGSWLARDWYERARCIVVAPSRDWRGQDSWLVVRGQERRLTLGGPFVIADMPTVDPSDERPDNGRAQRLGSALHLACVAAADARDAQGRAAAIVVVSYDGQVRDLGRDADAAVRAYADSIAAYRHDHAASGIVWEFDPFPARRFWAALGATA